MKHRFEKYSIYRSLDENNAYTCVWPKCRENEDCASGFCCTADDSLRGDKEREGRCVKGVYKGKYLCDPVLQEFKEVRPKNIFDIILSFLTNLF